MRVVMCSGCPEMFMTGMFGEEAVSGSDALVAAHVNGWDTTDPDNPVCPACQGKEKIDEE
jgi:hypothetical protein